MTIKYKRFQGRADEVERKVNEWLDEFSHDVEITNTIETYEPCDVMRPTIHLSVFYRAE